MFMNNIPLFQYFYVATSRNDKHELRHEAIMHDTIKGLMAVLGSLKPPDCHSMQLVTH